MAYLLCIPGIIINYLILTDYLVAYPKPMAVILFLMCSTPFLALIGKGIIHLFKKLYPLDGFGGYMLALIFGTRIMGKAEVNQIRIFLDAKGNPYAEDDFSNYAKVLEIKNGYVKYARYSPVTNDFTLTMNSDLRTFLYTYPLAKTNLDKFT